MKRISSTEREGYVELVNNQGLVYTHEDPEKEATLLRYWRENAYYSFTSAEIAELEKAAAAVFELCEEAGDWLLSPEGAEDLKNFGIPDYAMKALVASWNEEPACGSVYGRFDFRFGGLDHADPAMRIPKLYEFNADTPTSLVESTVQWFWLENTGHGQDQFNSLHENLVAAWKRNLGLIEGKLGHKPLVYFMCSSGDESHEDEMNTLLLLDTCRQAGYDTETLYIENLWLGDDGRYYDPRHDRHIEVAFKLYPWEHMAHEEHSRELFKDMDDSGYEGPYAGGTIWIEPPYKMLWSTKALLPVLWKLFKNDPRGKYLIPTWFEAEAPVEVMNGSYARKPLLSREGADITLHEGGAVEFGEIQGYGEEGFVIQELAKPPLFLREDEGEEVSTVLGVWMIDGEPAGMGIRESGGPITDNFANFVPHSISDGPKRYESKPLKKEEVHG